MLKRTNNEDNVSELIKLLTFQKFKILKIWKQSMCDTCCPLIDRLLKAQLSTN